MPAATAVAITANANSAIAIAEAEAARTLACKGFVRGFQHDTATVSQMREYAGCIDRLYPEALSDSSTVILKIAIVLLLLSIPAGALWSRRESFNTWSDTLMYSLVAPFLLGGGMLIVGVIWLAVSFLINA